MTGYAWRWGVGTQKIKPVAHLVSLERGRQKTLCGLTREFVNHIDPWDFVKWSGGWLSRKGSADGRGGRWNDV